MIIIYSIRRSHLKRIHKPFPYYILEGRIYGVLIGNSLHWLVSIGNDCCDHNFIVAFDLGDDHFLLCQSIIIRRFMFGRIGEEIYL